MLWIKRNVIFLVGLVVAVALLGYASLRLWDAWGQNQQVRTNLEDEWGQLANLYNEDPFPQAENLNAIQGDIKRLHHFIAASSATFKPISPMPFNGQQGFKTELDKMVHQLHADAKTSKVQVPTNYYYSFQAQRSLIKFTPQSLSPMAQQMAQIQAICKVLYNAQVDRIEFIQRARVSEDDGDVASTGSDYVNQRIYTNSLGTVYPYRIIFRSFSSELASVINGLVSSPHGFVVKTIDLEPAPYDPNAAAQAASEAEAANAMNAGAPAQPMAPPPVAVDDPSGAAPVAPTFKLQSRTARGRASRLPPVAPPPVAVPQPVIVPGVPAPPPKLDTGGLVTVFNERAFRVSLFMEVVSLRGGHN